MADTKLTITEIELGLARFFDMRVNIIIPNVSWGFLNHEADLIVMDRQGFLTEVEIKRSWADFMADFKKKHKHNDPRISWRYYAVPETISNKCMVKLQELDSDKRWGLITYQQCGKGCHCSFVYHPKNINVTIPHRSLRYEDRLKLARLGVLRIWNLKQTIISMKK